MAKRRGQQKIVYPFETLIAQSPFRETSGDKELLVFHFLVLPLWKLSAAQYMREHAVSMYALLPTMIGADAALLNQTIDELIVYYKDNDEKLARELYWLGIILRRVEVIPLPDKQEIAAPIHTANAARSRLVLRTQAV